MLLPIRFQIVSLLTPPHTEGWITPKHGLNKKSIIIEQQFWDSYQLWVVLFHHSIKISFLKSYIKSNNRRAKPCNKHSLAGSFLFGGRPKNVVLTPDFETTCLLLHLSPIITNNRPKLPTMPLFAVDFILNCWKLVILPAFYCRKSLSSNAKG